MAIHHDLADERADALRASCGKRNVGRFLVDRGIDHCRRRAVCEPVRVVGSIEIAGARTGYCVVTVPPDPPLRRDGQLGQRIVELLVRDHRPEAGREERIVRPAQVRRRPDDALRRAHQDDAIVVAVRDQQISGKRTAKNGRQAEDTLRGPRRRLERRERASHRLQLTGRRQARRIRPVYRFTR